MIQLINIAQIVLFSVYSSNTLYQIVDVVPKSRPSSESSKSSMLSTAAITAIMEKLKSDNVRDSTKRNYYSVWHTFNEFFVRLDVKPNNWEDRIALFVTYLVHKQYRSQTVQSYISAIRGVLKLEQIKVKEDKFLLSALTRACKLKNDRIKARLPI